jgi:predicted DNA-binding transcriptional regulator AlpA
VSGRDRALQPAPTSSQESQRDSHGPVLLSQKQVCARLGISDDTWRRWRKRGVTPPQSDLPGHPRWRADDIEAFGQRRKVARSFFITAGRRA